MKFNDRYDTDDIFAWYDDDPQDGTYFREQEAPRMDTYDEDAPFGNDRDQALERRKRRAALYITAHKELLKQQDYLSAYNKILDEYAREYAYVCLQQPISVVSEKLKAQVSPLKLPASARERWNAIRMMRYTLSIG